MCKNTFSPIIFRDDNIGIKDIKKRNYKIISSKSSVKFYKTIYGNVQYID